MTREQFIKRWEREMAGWGLMAMVNDLREGPMAKAQRVLDIPDDARRLLGRLYDDLFPQANKENGK